MGKPGTAFAWAGPGSPGAAALAGEASSATGTPARPPSVSKRSLTRSSSLANLKSTHTPVDARISTLIALTIQIREPGPLSTFDLPFRINDSDGVAEQVAVFRLANELYKAAI